MSSSYSLFFWFSVYTVYFYFKSFTLDTIYRVQCTWCIYVSTVMFLRSYGISVLQYFLPMILRTQGNIWPYDSFRSDAHSILLIGPSQELKILSVFSWHCYHKDPCSWCTQICRPDSHTVNVWLDAQCTTFVGRTHTFCRSDAQLL